MLVDELGVGLDAPLRLLDAVDLVDRRDERRVESSTLVTDLAGERRFAADVHVSAGVDVREQMIERLADGVGEHERARHERNAEQYGDAGGQEAQLAR